MTATVRRCETGWLGRTVRCGAPAEGKYRRSCEHGHSREGFMCAEHAKPPSTAWCRSCHDEGHLCELDLVRIGEAA